MGLSSRSILAATSNSLVSEVAKVTIFIGKRGEFLCSDMLEITSPTLTAQTIPTLWEQL